jgi:hypothetical protein
MQPPPPPPTLCVDSFNFDTLCDTPIDDATCESLGCREKGFTCAAADCGDGSGCTPLSPKKLTPLTALC